MSMPQELAHHLLNTGAVLLITGCPKGTIFGMDLNSYQIDDRFRGVKMIPSGPHYVFTSSITKNKQKNQQHEDPITAVLGATVRTGFCHYFHPQEVLTQEWDPQNEELRPRKCSTEELTTIKMNLEQFDQFLAPYDYETLGQWKTFVKHITEEKIKNYMPKCGLIRPSVEFESLSESERPHGTDESIISSTQSSTKYRNLANKIIECENDFLPKLKIVADTAIRFIELPERYSKLANPSEITESFMDSIKSVNLLLKQLPTVELILEECEISFIFFLIGHSLDALAHWRRILNILTNSEEAVTLNVCLYRGYLELLINQLPELPDELKSQNPQNLIHKDLQKLVENCRIGGLEQEVTYFQRCIQDSMGWLLNETNEEDPEDLPVIVEL